MLLAVDRMCIECRLLFWDTVKDKYKVDMSAMKPFAMKCLVGHVHVQPVDGQEVMARPAEICSYSLSTVQLSDLIHVKVNLWFSSINVNYSIFHRDEGHWLGLLQ